MTEISAEAIKPFKRPQIVFSHKRRPCGEAKDTFFGFFDHEEGGGLWRRDACMGVCDWMGLMGFTPTPRPLPLVKYKGVLVCMCGYVWG